MYKCTEIKVLVKLIMSFFKLFGLIDVIRFHGVVKGALNMKFKPYGIEVAPWVTLATLKKMKKDI